MALSIFKCPSEMQGTLGHRPFKGWGGRECVGEKGWMGNGFGLPAGMNRFSQDTSAEDSGFFVGLLCWIVASFTSLQKCSLFVHEMVSRRNVWVGVSLPTFWLFYYLYYTPFSRPGK